LTAQVLNLPFVPDTRTGNGGRRDTYTAEPSALPWLLPSLLPTVSECLGIVESSINVQEHQPMPHLCVLVRINSP
jgi:hypothetical protein